MRSRCAIALSPCSRKKSTGARRTTDGSSPKVSGSFVRLCSWVTRVCSLMEYALTGLDAANNGHRMRIAFLREQQENVQAVVGMLVARKRELIELERARAVARRDQAGVVNLHESAINCWMIFVVSVFPSCRCTWSFLG